MSLTLASSLFSHKRIVTFWFDVPSSDFDGCTGGGSWKDSKVLGTLDPHVVIDISTAVVPHVSIDISTAVVTHVSIDISTAVFPHVNA